MSEELLDEVEAINSIYGDGTLIPADGESTNTYILKLPGDASQLRLQFPSGYPSQPPEVLGTHHASGGRKGAGARDLGLFRDALTEVFQEGLVCIFDAMEDFGRRYEEDVVLPEQEAQDGKGESHVPAQEQQAEEQQQQQQHEHLNGQHSSREEDLPAPTWYQSALFEENKSTFLAHVAPVTSPATARRYVEQLLASDRRIRDATHNMTAWRIRGEGGSSYQDCDDDGEAAAGGRLLHLMQLMDLWDAMVVVTRWYGGQKLGPRRFAVINATAKDGFVRAGMVPDKEKEKKGKGR